VHAAYSCDDSPGRDAVSFIQVPASERREFEKGRSRVQEAINSLTRSKLPATYVSLECFSTAAQLDEVGSFPELGYEACHLRRISLERREGGCCWLRSNSGHAFALHTHPVVVTPAVDS